MLREWVRQGLRHIRVAGSASDRGRSFSPLGTMGQKVQIGVEWITNSSHRTRISRNFRRKSRSEPWHSDASTSSFPTKYQRIRLKCLCPSTPDCAGQLAGVAHHFLAWLHQNDFDFETVDDQVLRQFVNHECECQPIAADLPRQDFARKIENGGRRRRVSVLPFACFQ